MALGEASYGYQLNLVGWIDGHLSFSLNEISSKRWDLAFQIKLTQHLTEFTQLGFRSGDDLATVNIISISLPNSREFNQ